MRRHIFSHTTRVSTSTAGASPLKTCVRRVCFHALYELSFRRGGETSRHNDPCFSSTIPATSRDYYWDLASRPSTKNTCGCKLNHQGTAGKPFWVHLFDQKHTSWNPQDEACDECSSRESTSRQLGGPGLKWDQNTPWMNRREPRRPTVWWLVLPIVVVLTLFKSRAMNDNAAQPHSKRNHQDAQRIVCCR